jgi:hypothetical protein
VTRRRSSSLPLCPPAKKEPYHLQQSFPSPTTTTTITITITTTTITITTTTTTTTTSTSLGLLSSVVFVLVLVAGLTYFVACGVLSHFFDRVELLRGCTSQ